MTLACNSGSVEDAERLALHALAWILSDECRAHRFLDLTGFTPDNLRELAGKRSTLQAVLAFLENHEPDLVAAAEALGENPETLVSAGAMLHHNK